MIVQPETVVDYSPSGGVLREGLLRLGARGRQRGAQLMEAIHEVTKDVRREGTRPVIVVVRVGYEAPTTVPGDQVREQLRKSGAILYVVSSVGAQRAPPSQARPGISAEQAQLRADEDADGALDLGQVLGDGSRESGGRHEQIVSTTLVGARASRGRAAESVRDHIRAASGRKARRQALRVVEAQGRYDPRAVAAPDLTEATRL